MPYNFSYAENSNEKVCYLDVFGGLPVLNDGDLGG